MNEIQKRFLLFLIGCIGTRASLVYISKNYSKNNKVKNLLLIFSLLVSTGFLVIYFKGLRKTGTETFGANIWWNQLRPLHAFLYLLFAISLYKEYEFAWIFLLLDVIIGLLAFTLYHYSECNFSKLLIKNSENI
jgi:hypothetical protein